MNNSRLLFVLKKLDRDAKKSFLSFLQSPFFNRRQDVCRLGEQVIDAMDKHPQNLQKAKVWTKVYPGQIYNDQKMRLLMSYTFKLLEKYLSVNSFLQASSKVDYQLIIAYRELDLEKPFLRTWSVAKRRLEKQALRDYTYLRDQYDLEAERHAYLGLKKQKEETRIQDLNELLDQQFIYQKLKQGSEFYARNTILEEANQSSFLDSILIHLQARPEGLKEIGIEVYYRLLQLLKYPEDEDQLDPFLQLLDQHYSRFTMEEMGNIFRLLINFCIRKMNAGKSDFIQRTFDFYRKGIEQGFLLDKGEISAFTYTNVMFIGFKLKVFDWVEAFLEEYRNHLEAAQRDNIYYFCLANLHYEQDRLAEAMKLLVRFDAKHDFFLYLSAQTTLIKIYYQLKEFEPLESLLQSISTYLNRKNNIGYRKAPYKKLISVCRKMIYLRPGDADKIQRLRQEIDQITIPSLRLWLLKQLDSL